MNLDTLLELHRALYENNEYASGSAGNAFLLPETGPLPTNKKNENEVRAEEAKTMWYSPPEQEDPVRFYKPSEIDYPSLPQEKEEEESSRPYDKVLRWSNRSYSQGMDEVLAI